MNIRFPKEEIRLVEIIRNAILEQDNLVIIEQYENVIQHASFLSQYYGEILNLYVKALFCTKEFEKVLNFVEEMRKRNLENCSWYFYVFMWLITQKDFYYAKSMINKSVLFNDNSIKRLISEEEANYNSIINLHYSLLSTIGPSLILINFINELLSESLNRKIDDEYIIMRFFDLLNILYEYGIENEIIDVFRNSLEVVYEIEIV